jgi:hypothetical protein
MPARQRAQRAPEQKFITPDMVTERVRRIGAWSAQDETALSMEYELYRAVIASIAMGAPMARELAEAAIQSQRWGFERRTARSLWKRAREAHPPGAARLGAAGAGGRAVPGRRLRPPRRGPPALRARRPLRRLRVRALPGAPVAARGAPGEAEAVDGEQWSATIVAVAALIAFAVVVLGLMDALPWQNRKGKEER